LTTEYPVYQENHLCSQKWQATEAERHDRHRRERTSPAFNSQWNGYLR